MLALALGSNACTPCMATSTLENGEDPNASPPETRTPKQNQAESVADKVPFFNRPVGFTALEAVLPKAA